jgi:hypothetical protein
VSGKAREKPVEGTAEEIPVDESVAEAAAAAGLTPRDVDPAEADEFKPLPGDLVVRGQDDIYRVMDRADEIQILDELQTRPIKEMVYSFSQPGGGGKVTDLSYAGVRECVRTLNRGHYTAIRIGAQPPIVDEVTEEGESYYRVMVYAEDEATGAGQWGTAVEPKHIQKRNGDRPWDKFALTKALNKAQRNAMKALLPVEFVESIKAIYLGDMDKVREIAAGPGAEALAELPPPDDSPEMKELMAQARTEYEALKKIDAAALLPARFNVLMTHAQHDQDRMRDFIAHIQSEIAVRTEVGDAEQG